MANAARSPRRRAGPLRGLVCCAGLMLVCRGLTGVKAQTDAEPCADVVVDGLDEDDGFPAASMVYTNAEEEEDVRGQYISEEGTHFIWYSPTDPTEYTAETPDAEVGDCNGLWVISSYPVNDTFSDTVWYQSADGAQCDLSPAELGSSDWLRVTRDTVEEATTSDEATVGVTCSAEEDSDDGGGLSNRTVIVLLIVIGVGFMVLMCLGALACCVKGKNTAEEAVMPPGELGEGSAIGGKAGGMDKPGLHAHPEVHGSQHPHPEDWAPAYTSNRSSIPQGSRSGPSVRSIGYS